jgi:16S rRNA (guanine527-N7)-methyltransferase
MTTDFQQAERLLHVSRETWAAFDHYVRRLVEWQHAQNLVSASTIDQVWTRHIVDCAQIFQLAPLTGNWLDVGSGAGLPGLIGAIYARFERAGEDCQFVLVESNRRKCAFLRTICRELELNCVVVPQRIESLQTSDFPQISHLSARAVAALPQLLAWGAVFFATGADAYLQKGRDYSAEVENASHAFDFDLVCYDSIVEENSVILHLSDIRRRTRVSGTS